LDLERHVKEDLNGAVRHVETLPVEQHGHANGAVVVDEGGCGKEGRARAESFNICGRDGSERHVN
jgi:hypothetical protein